MKILKHGDLQPRKFTCIKCGCEFVADTTEYYTKHSECFKVPDIYFVQCPECGNRVIAADAPLYTKEENRPYGDATGYWV